MWAVKTVTPPISSDSCGMLPVCASHIITRCSDHWNAMCVAAWSQDNEIDQYVSESGCISFRSWHYSLLSPWCYQLLSYWLITWNCHHLTFEQFFYLAKILETLFSKFVLVVDMYLLEKCTHLSSRRDNAVLVHLSNTLGNVTFQWCHQHRPQN